MRKIILLLITIAPLFGISHQAMAQSKEALAKAQYMLRQLNAEKITLQQENAKLKQEIEALKKDNEKQLSKSQQGNKKLSNTVDALKSRNSQMREMILQANDKFRDMQVQQKNQGQLINQYSEKLSLCIANNKELFDVNTEMLEKYQKKGVWKALAKAEPFTKLQKVKIENLIQDYQYRIEDLQVEPDPVLEQSVVENQVNESSAGGDTFDAPTMSEQPVE